MNRYSLKFENSILEDKYISYSYKQQVIHIRNFIRLSFPIMICQALACFVDGSYIGASFALAFIGLGQSLLIAISKLSDLNAVRLYEICQIGNPFIGVLAFYFSNSLALNLNTMALLIIEIQLFVITPHVHLAIIHFINHFLAIQIIMYMAFGFTLYMLTWIPIFIFCIYHYYTQKKMQRLLFQGSQVNQSIYNLIKDTAIDDVIYFKLNQEKLQYELEFTTLLNLDLSAFLSSMQVDPQQNLKQYLFTQTKAKIHLDKHKIAVFDTNKQKIHLDIYIQYYPEIRFFIRIIKKQQITNIFTEKESSFMYLFYKKLQIKCQQQSQKINLDFIIQQLCSLNARVQFERILTNKLSYLWNIQQFSILVIMKQQLKNLQMQFEFKSVVFDNDIINTSEIIFQTMIYYMLRIIRVRNIGIIVILHRQEDHIQIKLQFLNSVFSYSLFQVKAKKISLLQDLLSQKPLIIEENQIICFVDQRADLPFK